MRRHYPILPLSKRNSCIAVRSLRRLRPGFNHWKHKFHQHLSLTRCCFTTLQVAFHQAFFHHEAMVLSCLVYQSFFRQVWRSKPVECSTPIRQLLLRKELRYLMWQHNATHTLSQTGLSQCSNRISVSQGAPVQRLRSGGNPSQSTRQAFRR